MSKESGVSKDPVTVEEILSTIVEDYAARLGVSTGDANDGLITFLKGELKEGLEEEVEDGPPVIGSAIQQLQAVGEDIDGMIRALEQLQLQHGEPVGPA